MAEKGAGYTVSDIYQGGTSSIDYTQGGSYLGKKALARVNELGMTTNPMVVNQIAELSSKLAAGTVPVEVGVLRPEQFDQLPKQQFEELRRKADLTGSKLSLHAPLVDPSGMGEKGWDESQRVLAERQLKDVIDKAALMKQEGKMLPVTIHAANSSGSTFRMTEEGKKHDTLIAVNRETGQIVPIKEDYMYTPGGPEGFTEKLKDPMKRLEMQNATQWDNDVDKVIFQKEMGDRILQEVYPAAKELYMAVAQKPELFNELPQVQQQAILNIQTANAHLKDAQQVATSVFSKAYQYGDDEIKKKVAEAGKRFEINLLGGVNPEKFDSLSKEQQQKAIMAQHDLQNQSKAIQLLTEELRDLDPKLFVPVEEFSTKHASETFANVAKHAYDKYGDKAPTLSIENLYQGMGFSQAEDMEKLILKTKEEFVKKQVESGMNKKEAQKAADKLIGVTFDMGHAYLSKPYGFSKEDVRKEAEKLSKYIKHVHVTDNFGYSDSHLPPGMGEVPIKEILETLEKQGVSGTKIVEAGGWFEHFKTNPFQYVLESMGSPMYSEGIGTYWNQSAGLHQGYLGGYGMMLPNTHYQQFGAGFSQLPSELGGSVGGAGGSRMSGRPME